MAFADYAMSSGLEDLNDKEVMDMIQQQVADFSSLYPNYIRPSPSEATAYPIPSDDSQLSPNETMFNRVINRVSPPDPDGPNPRRGMFRVTPGREGESVYGKENFTFEDLMTEYLNQGSSSPFDPDGPNPARPRPRMLTNPSKAKDLWRDLMGTGLDYLNANKEESSQAPLMDKYGSGFEDPTKQTKKEPELFGTLWNLIQKSFQEDAQSLTGMFGEGKDKKDTDTPFFKPLSASQLVEHEKFVNQAPLLERWAAQMKEQIGWQYMTPDERKDYIKKNKKNKNNHIIMHWDQIKREDQARRG